VPFPSSVVDAMPEEGEAASTPDEGEAAHRRTFLGKELSVGQDILLIPMTKRHKYVNKLVRTWVTHTLYQSQGATLSNLLTHGQVVNILGMNTCAAGNWLFHFCGALCVSCSMCVVLYLYQSEGAIIGWRLRLSSILCGMIFVIKYLLIYSKRSNPSPVKSFSVRISPLSKMQD